MLVQSDAAELAVIFGKMDRRDDNVVFRHPLRRQAGGQVIPPAKGALSSGLPLLLANAHGLGDSDTLSRLKPFKNGHHRWRNRSGGGAQRLRRQIHSSSVLLGLPRTKAIRPVRASSKI